MAPPVESIAILVELELMAVFGVFILALMLFVVVVVAAEIIIQGKKLVVFLRWPQEEK
jgi:hypothetical protein